MSRGGEAQIAQNVGLTQPPYTLAKYQKANANAFQALREIFAGSRVSHVLLDFIKTILTLGSVWRVQDTPRTWRWDPRPATHA